MESTDVRVARLEEQLKSVQSDVTDIRVDQKSQNHKLDKLLEVHHQRKGAQALVKALSAVGGGSGVAALIAHFWDKVFP